MRPVIWANIAALPRIHFAKRGVKNMGIERMTAVKISGSADRLDDVLERCMQSGVFQPENAAKLSEYSIGASPLLRNPYGGLLVKIGETASHLKIGLEYRDFSELAIGAQGRDAFSDQAHEYLNILRQEYPRYFERKNKLHEEIMSYTAALDMLGRVHTPDINFDELFSGSFLQVRFGRLPAAGAKKLEVYGERPYALFSLSEESGFVWCIYITAQQFETEIDELFRDVGFTRLRIPDYVHGTADDAITFVKQGLEEERALSEKTTREIDTFVSRERETFLMLYARAKFLHDAYDLRKYVVSLRGVFHVVGFVTTRDKESFLALFDEVEGVKVQAVPAGGDTRLQTPVKLRNNWFTRPFEMFVTMYGSPSYNDIDPTPFVAYTYSLLFGIMFGDVGQGFLIMLLGIYLHHKRGMALGGIMSRIGVSSMAFGALYGSVFGSEHLMDPLFHAMGFHEKPIEVMQPATTNTILVAAVGLGVAIILMVIVFNICVGLKHRDPARVIFSHNGLSGLVFYASVLYAAVSMLAGRDVLSPPYILCLFVLPLLLIFFKEPIAKLIRLQTNDTIIHRSKTLADSATFQKGSTDIPELFTTKFVTARFGRIPTDSYSKLQFYESEPFMLHPVKSDREYIWCIYAMAAGDKQQIDAIFHDLYFERIYIPDECLENNQKAEAFIKSCIESDGSPDGAVSSDSIPDQAPAEKPVSHRRTVFRQVFPEGLGSFVVESFFELFEVLLSFVTNTMSFLRVGGFILSHAGMMSVVYTLSDMVGSGASPVVLVLGNLFVMALEGLIVGIQALRLEFYEMFSRFFDAEGTAFTPARVSYAPKI